MSKNQENTTPNPEELLKKMFGKSSEEETTGSDMLGGLLGNIMGEDSKADMINKQAQSMLTDFNGMLTQVTFDLLLSNLTPVNRTTIKENIYDAWKDRMDESVDESKKDQSANEGLSEMFGVTDIIQKSFDKADVVVKDFLGLSESN